MAPPPLVQSCKCSIQIIPVYAMSDVTQILSQIEGGDGQVAEKLLPLVHD